MEILVFKTSVLYHHQVEGLQAKLDEVSGAGNWNFDLEDCDKVLRVVSFNASTQDVIHLIQKEGFFCEELMN